MRAAHRRLVPRAHRLPRPPAGWLAGVQVCHAEMNAVLNKNSASAKNCRLYVALFPCNECAKLLIQAGIREGE